MYYDRKRANLSALQDMSDHDGADPVDTLCSSASSSSSRPKQDDGGIGTSSLGTILDIPPIKYSSSSSKEGSVPLWFAISAFHCSKASWASVFLPRTSKVSSRWFSSPVDCSCTFLRDCWTAPTAFRVRIFASIFSSRQGCPCECDCAEMLVAWQAWCVAAISEDQARKKTNKNNTHVKARNKKNSKGGGSMLISALAPISGLVGQHRILMISVYACEIMSAGGCVRARRCLAKGLFVSFTTKGTEYDGQTKVSKSHTAKHPSHLQIESLHR